MELKFKINIIYIVFSFYIRHLWNYNAKYISYILCFSDYIRHLWNYNAKLKSYLLCFSDYFTHLWNYNENKNHINCDFRIILHTYGIIMKIKIIYIEFFGLY